MVRSDSGTLPAHPLALHVLQNRTKPQIVFWFDKKGAFSNLIRRVANATRLKNTTRWPRRVQVSEKEISNNGEGVADMEHVGPLSPKIAFRYKKTVTESAFSFFHGNVETITRVFLPRGDDTNGPGVCFNIFDGKLCVFDVSKPDVDISQSQEILIDDALAASLFNIADMVSELTAKKVATKKAVESLLALP